jgi:class 3 adenylate cyclase/tetratricopeptide (TPR) repeat protein
VADADRSERKLTTVLFADLAGSTTLADEQDPERTRVRLERFYDAMTAEIEAAGGTIEKFAGDAVMAAFGAPEALEDHAERALHTALSMQRRLDAVFDGELSLRIGVNTGEVVVGRPREGSSFVSGDAVNVAARLEQAAEPGEILAGERTVAAVRGAFEFDEPKAAEAKGKPEGVRCRRLVRALSLMRTRGVGGLARAFVGREAELERLQGAFRRAAERSRPVLVTILGDAGVGKTRLVRELWEWLSEEDPEPLRRTGRCLAYGQGITYWPLAEVLKEHLGILENDPPEEVRRRLGDREILGLTLGLDLAEDLHPLAARDRLHATWVSFLSDLTAERPVVVLVEDVHLAEDPLLDLIERLGRDVQGPLLILATARPDFADGRAAWNGRMDSETLWLEPLTTESAASLIDSLLAGDLPPPVRELIVERAEGNPFFVEEVLGSLIDAGVLEPMNGGWRTGELPPDFEIPDSVQAVLAARIDLLGEAEKAALQAAAVIGRVFWTGPVYELVEGLEPDLHALESRDFIRQRAGSSLEGEVEYVFKHQLTREVAYGGLTKARRARLHAQFADWIERLGEGRDEHAPLLAHHYAEAVRPEDADLAWADQAEELKRLRSEAIRWLRRSAELALRRYDLDEAIPQLEGALELEADQVRKAELWRELGRAHALAYDGEKFWAAMEKSLEVCFDRATCAETYAELGYQTACRAGMWRTAPDADLVNGWIDKAFELSEPESSARAKALIAKSYWSPTTEEEAARAASALAEKLGDANLRFDAWAARSGAAAAAGRYDEALTWAQRPFEFLGEIQNPELESEIHYVPIPPAIMLGRFREARRLARRFDELSLPLTPHHRVHGVSILVEVEELLGGWDEIGALEPRVRDAIGENLDTPCVRNPRSLLVCAVARAVTGFDDESRRLEEEAESLQMQGYPTMLNPPRLRLALARGDLDRVRLLVSEAPTARSFWFGLSAQVARWDGLAALRDRERVEEECAPLMGARDFRGPFALRALGIVREDKSLIQQAIARFAALKLDWHAAQTHELR